MLKLHQSVDADLIPSILISYDYSLVAVIRALAGADKFEQAGAALSRQAASLNSAACSTTAGSLAVPEHERIAPDGGLTDLQKQLFFQRGFVVLRNAVSAPLVETARGLINESLGKGKNLPP